MKYVTIRPPSLILRRSQALEIAKAVEAVQDGRNQIENPNGPFCSSEGGSPTTKIRCRADSHREGWPFGIGRVLGGCNVDRTHRYI